MHSKCQHCGRSSQLLTPIPSPPSVAGGTALGAAIPIRISSSIFISIYIYREQHRHTGFKVVMDIAFSCRI